MQLKKSFFVPLMLTLLVFLAACNKKEGCTDPNALNYDPDAETNVGCEYISSHSVETHFHAHVADETLLEGNTYTIGGVVTELTFARFYISNPRLIDSDGNEVSAPVKYLLILPATDDYEIGELPDGSYTGIRFEIGVDSVTNHSDPTQYAVGDPLGAQFPNMSWGWDMGYIFLRIDGVADSDADGVPDDGFEMHLGGDEYLASVQVDYPITIGDGNENIFHLNANWAEIFAGVDLANDNTTHTSDNFPLADMLFDNLQNFISPED